MLSHDAELYAGPLLLASQEPNLDCIIRQVPVDVQNTRFVPWYGFRGIGEVFVRGCGHPDGLSLTVSRRLE